MTESEDRSRRPDPDPTIRTNEQLLREVLGVRELLETRMTGDEAITVERFAAVEKQFAALEAHRIEQKKDAETSIAAALSAAEKAVREQTVASERSITKTETSTAETLKQLTSTQQVATGALDKQIQDLKERVGELDRRLSSRLDTGEGNLAGSRGARHEQRGDYTLFAQAASPIIAAIAIAVGVIVAVLH